MMANERFLSARTNFSFAWSFLKKGYFRWFLVSFCGGLLVLVVGPEKAERVEKKLFDLLLLKRDEEKKDAPPK
jgi:hypothetical protein